MGFLRTNELIEVKNGEFNLDFGVLVKTVRDNVWKTEI